MFNFFFKKIKVFFLKKKNTNDEIYTIPNLKTENVMFNYGLGGQEVKQDASEGMADLPLNRTMFVQKLTNDDPYKPEAVYDLKTVDEVFNYFKPNIDIDFVDEEGNLKSENIRYSTVADFSAASLTKQSVFLQNLKMQHEQYQKILKQLKSNKVMGKLLESPEGKAAFLSLISSLISELDENDSK